MNHNEEIEVVKKALSLEKDMQACKDTYSKFSRESFPAMPAAPIKPILTKPAYPEPEVSKPNYWIWFIPTICLLPLGGIPGILWGLGYWYWYKNKKQKETEAIVASDEYKAKCFSIDTQYEEDVKKATEEYEIASAEYTNKVVPEYKAKKGAWEEQHQTDVSTAQSALEKVINELNTHYSDTQLIPLKYHNIEALKYIYDVISSSQYSFKEACDDYERDKQRILDEARLAEQQNANYLAQQQADLTAQQNALLDEQNSIAEKARRDQNIAAVVGAVQHHNTNKILSGKR